MPPFKDNTMHAFDQLNTATMLDAALHYHAMEWRVIPLIEKKPVTSWTTDPRHTTRTIQAFFEPPSVFNIGVVMGAASNIIAFDIDGQAGQDALAQAIEKWPPSQNIYNTLTFRTPNNGLRLIYQYAPVPSRAIRSNGKECLRIMSDGTQTVMPPSILENAKELPPYRWTAVRPIAPAPIDLIEAILAANRPNNRTQELPLRPDYHMHGERHSNYNRARAYVAASEGAVTGQYGGTRTFKLAVRLVHGFKLNYHEAMEILMTVFNPRCTPEWTEAEMARKVDEALASTKTTPNML